MSRKKKKQQQRQKPKHQQSSAGPQHESAAESSHRPLRGKGFIRLAAGLVVAVLLVFLFSHLSALHKLQTVVQDTRMRLNAPPKSSDVVVVRITTEDYLSIFKGRSPLDPAKLEQLIRAIASGKPKIIGMDIDTTSRLFREMNVDKGPPDIIWGREVRELPEDVGMRPEPLPVLGGKDPEITEHYSGLALLVEDAEDRVTRRYRRIIETTEGPLPSFIWAIVSRLQTERTNELKPTSDDIFIRYAGDSKASHLFTMDASTVLALTKDRPLPEDNPFRDKIVLVGGEYLGQDQHQTPLGLMSGVKVLAQVIETELEGGGDRAPNRLSIILLEIFEGILVVLLFHLMQTYGFARTLALSVLTVLALSLLCSVVAFGTPLRFSYFIPILLCILIFEFIVEYRTDLVKKLGGQFGGASHHHAK